MSCVLFSQGHALYFVGKKGLLGLVKIFVILFIRQPFHVVLKSKS